MQPVFGGGKSTFMLILSSGKMLDYYLVINLWLSKPCLVNVMITFQLLEYFIKRPGCCFRDRMVVGYTSAFAVIANHH